MATYELYGYIGDEISYAKEFLEKAIGVELVARDSAYHGSYFIYGDTSGEHLLLKKNLDPFDGDPVEISYGSYGVLLYANEVEPVRSIERFIVKDNGFALLRREEI